MLNRTNRTLSANLNRLNLGTRSLAHPGALNGKNTVRIHQAHGFSMRDGMFGSSDPSIRPSISRTWNLVPNVPGSTPAEPLPVERNVVRPPVSVATTPEAWAFRTATAACFRFAAQGQPQSMSRPWPGRQPARDALKAKRPNLGYARGADRAYADWTAAAATVATAEG